MAWQIKPFSHRCHLLEKTFEEGDTYVSFLVVDSENELQRYDVSAEKEEAFEPTGEVICRWTQVYKEPPEKDDSAKRQRETAEELFLMLFEGGDAGDEDSSEENEVPVLKKFLGLLLERKRVLRPRGKSSDGQYRLMEHRGTKTIYPVPAGDLDRDELMQISDRLNDLIIQSK